MPPWKWWNVFLFNVWFLFFLFFIFYIDARPSIIGKKKPVATKKGVGGLILTAFLFTQVGFVNAALGSPAGVRLASSFAAQTKPKHQPEHWCC